MKIDRLIGILSILLQQEKVTAPYLAEKFEVSRRTIIRDVEALCKAGIPIVTAQGREGGISIMDGYRVDRTVLVGEQVAWEPSSPQLRKEQKRQEDWVYTIAAQIAYRDQLTIVSISFGGKKDENWARGLILKVEPVQQ